LGGVECRNAVLDQIGSAHEPSRVSDNIRRKAHLRVYILEGHSIPHLSGRCSPNTEIISLGETFGLLLVEVRSLAQLAGKFQRIRRSGGHCGANSRQPLSALACLFAARRATKSQAQTRRLPFGIRGWAGIELPLGVGQEGRKRLKRFAAFA
jgi:hypothetical protein